MFDLIAEFVELIYKVWPSYGMAIILLTVAIRLVLTPLTIKGTKSMLAMRKLQPQVKKLQAQYKNDRTQLNQELSVLYRKHKINPLGGCFPLLVQLPVFIVLYQVIRGLTRRASDVGFAVGQFVNGSSSDAKPLKANFNPSYLDANDTLYKSLTGKNEMISWGLDLARNPWEALGDDIIKGLPYLALMLGGVVLFYLQQQQTLGRGGAEQSPQMRIIMRIFPVLIIPFSLLFPFPSAMFVYFIATGGVGVVQQLYLTRRIYRPEKERTEQEGDSEESSEDKKEDEKPTGLLGALSGGTQTKVEHGSSPLSRPAKIKPPKARSSKPVSKINQEVNQAKPANSKSQKPSKKKSQVEPTQAKPSKRVTPKKNINNDFKRKQR